MQKTQELLQILNDEERDAAEEFLNRKFKLLNAEQTNELEQIAASGRTVLEQSQLAGAGLDTTSKAGKMMVRIYGGAQEGLARLIRDCNLGLSQKKKEAVKGHSEEGDETRGAALEKLIIETDSEEEYAGNVIDSSIAKMTTAKIRELRDSCEKLLGWWQKEGGVQESLHINQWGNINTATGWIAIRKAREEFQQEEIAPFRGGSQTINLVYKKKNQEVQRIQREERLREEAGL
jgi:hypothetical protein